MLCLLRACIDSVGCLDDTIISGSRVPAIYDESPGKALLYDFAYQTMAIFDVSDPTNPKKIREIAMPDSIGSPVIPYSPTVMDSLLYVFAYIHGRASIMTFALYPDPTNPRLIHIAQFSKVKASPPKPPFPAQHPWGYSPETKTLYYFGDGILFILGLSNPLSPQPLGTFGSGLGLSESRVCRVYYPYMYFAYTEELDTITYRHHFQVYDVSNRFPELISEVSFVKTWGEFDDLEMMITPDGRRLVIATGRGHPNLFDVTDPSNISYDTSWGFLAWELAHNDDFSRVYGIFPTTGGNHIYIAEATDSSPELVCDFLDSTKWFDVITYHKGLLYLAGGWHGVPFLYIMKPQGEEVEEGEAPKGNLVVKPTPSSFLIWSPISREARFELYSPDGRLVLKKLLRLKEGLNELKLPKLRRGVYLGRVEGRGFKVIRGG